MNTLLAMDAKAIATEVQEAAYNAANEYFQTVLGGVDQYACGFAWVEVSPQYKGNTREGKAERQVLTELGFSKMYNGIYQLWNPANFPCQNIETLEKGAVAAAQVLKKYGIEAFATSRLD